MNTRSVVFVAAALACLWSQAADAHLVVSGMGPIYDGISHFGLSPEDFLPVATLALFAGLKGPRQSRRTLAAMTSAWFAGGMLPMLGVTFPSVLLPTLTALVFMSIGGLLAANVALPTLIILILALLLGLVRGAADLEGALLTVSHVLTLGGMAVSAFVVFSLVASVTLPLTRMWMIVAARVAGSWVAALGLLLLGWILRYGAAVR